MDRIILKEITVKKAVNLNRSGLAAIVLFLFSSNSIVLCQQKHSNEEMTLLKVTAGINYTFKNYAGEIWPGYDLSTNPYIAYLPDDFVLYLNAKNPPEGFEPYPLDWPNLGAVAFIHHGIYRDLAGQFAFDFQIDSITTFAMGLSKSLLFSFDNPSYMLLSTTFHEGFHQYQHHYFGDIPWSREENYPILDVENTALASLEMHILEDALKALFDSDRSEMEYLLKEFTAVRDYRWQHTEPYIRKYEQGQEINEGTARYVEMKAMECFLKLDSLKINNPLLTAIEKDMSGFSIKKLLIDDMESRLTGSAVAPDDMLRNRIYPVGASLGFLLDALKMDWKMKFQSAGSEVSFPDLLITHFKLDSIQLVDYLVKVKETYNFREIEVTAKNLINAYSVGYEEALEKFNSQPGFRIEINLSSNGLQRFRSSKDKKWIVENGRITLCLNYNLYSLKSVIDNGLLLEIHDTGLQDENNWEKRKKKVVFYSDSISAFILDNISTELTYDIDKKFEQIKIEGDNFNFEEGTNGEVSFMKNGIIIHLEQ